MYVLAFPSHNCVGDLTEPPTSAIKKTHLNAAVCSVGAEGEPVTPCQGSSKSATMNGQKLSAIIFLYGSLPAIGIQWLFASAPVGPI